LCLENTRNSVTKCTEQLVKFGITEDHGKAAITCARRLGIDIS